MGSIQFNIYIMAVLIINNQSFNYPDPGQEPGWGEDATAWAKAVTDTLNFLVSPGDLINQTAGILNNSANQAVVGCLFSSSIVRAANVSYQINRSTDDISLSQQGTIQINFSPTEGWSLASSFVGNDVGITFSISPTGQVLYTSSNLTGANYTGSIKYNAKTLSV